MKSISRKLSNLVSQSELPYTARSCVILDSNKDTACIFEAVAERIGEDIFVTNINYALKVNFICTDCSSVISSTVHQVSFENIEEMLRRTLTGNVTAFNIDVFEYSPDLTDNFIEQQYAFSLLFIMV
ncbi:MAG: hypothetical protein IKK43_00995 [Clostridia bacterium]|nr:hypothetical protein [Clostridia bacterium]